MLIGLKKIFTKIFLPQCLTIIFVYPLPPQRNTSPPPVKWTGLCRQGGSHSSTVKVNVALDNIAAYHSISPDSCFFCDLIWRIEWMTKGMKPQESGVQNSSFWGMRTIALFLAFPSIWQLAASQTYPNAGIHLLVFGSKTVFKTTITDIWGKSPK